MTKKNTSTIGQSMTIVGEVKCSGELIINGKIEGILTGATVVVGESGQLSGTIVADELECSGHVEGNIVSNKFIIHRGGCHFGTVETGELKVDPGAILDCVLQSGAATNIEPPQAEIDFNGILFVFGDRKRCCTMDVPWSERKKLLDQLLRLLEKGKQLIKITGENGSGKTAFIAKLAESLPDNIIPISISDPVGSVKDFLAIIAGALGVSVEGGESLPEMIIRIRTALNQTNGGGKKIVLTIDDAHTMYPATIEGVIRCLTNACGGDEELLQIILLGTDELEDKLVHSAKEYFEDETNCILALEPLTMKDTAEYLRYCIQVASNNNGQACMSLFPHEIIKKLHLQSRGNIAEINILAEKVLRDWS